MKIIKHMCILLSGAATLMIEHLPIVDVFGLVSLFHYKNVQWHLFFPVLGIEPRASCILGKGCTTELPVQLAK